MQREVVWALVLLVFLTCSGATALAAPAPDPLVEAAQRELAERGYDPGEVDGLMGSRTRRAIREFQRSAGLADTGRIDDATLAALGLDPPVGAEPEAGPDAPEADTPRAESAPPQGAEAPKAETPPAMPSPEPGPDASGSKAPRDETAPAPGTETPAAQAPSAKPSAEPDPDPSGAEAPRSEPAPERTVVRRLSFAALGWHPPQTGADALARFRAIGAPPGFIRGTDALVVPKGELVFVLKAGERIPGFDCDPGGAEGLSIEFIFGPAGPVIFTPATGAGYCQAGIGIALTVGRTLEMRRVDWGDVQYPRGTVRITNQGLEYVR